MLSKLKPKSEFSKNVLTLMTGTTIAQAIPIAISPILTRLYTPEDFGVFALFFAITSIFGSIANGRYELAIMLPKKDEDAINIFALGFIINIAMSLSLLLIVLIFHDYIVKLLNNKEISPWLYFIPISVFLMGIFNLLNYFNNRMKQYKDLAKANVYKSIGNAVIQLSLGFLKAGAIGLISGQIFSQIISNTKLFLNIKKLDLLKYIKKNKIIFLGKRYKDFLKFSMLAILINMFSQHIISIVIPIFYNITTLGFYSLVQRVLGIPSALIGNSIGQVFFQQAAKEMHETGKIIHTFDSTFKRLIIIGVPFYTFLFFTVKYLFLLVFGEKWMIAGTYAQILIPLFFVKFIVVPISNATSVLEKQKLLFFWQVGLLLLSLIILLFSYLYSIDFKTMLKYFTFFISIYYLIFFLIVRFYSKG